jgi:hypothetical protein
MKVMQILEESLKKVRKIKSYACIMELYSRSNGRENAKQSFLYRAPGDIRIEQLGSFRKGSVVVVDPNGKVRARGGGFLSFIKLELKRDSEVLKGITGDSAVESDWITIFQKTKNMAPYLFKYDAKPIRIGSQGGYDVMAYVKGQPFDRVRFVIREDGPIVLVERFKGDMLVHAIKWEDIEINPPVTDKDFEL